MGLLALILDIVRSRCCLAAEAIGIAGNGIAEFVCNPWMSALTGGLDAGFESMAAPNSPVLYGLMPTRPDTAIRSGRVADVLNTVDDARHATPRRNVSRLQQTV